MAIKDGNQQALDNEDKAKEKKAGEIKTEGPLSEKDEVKQAEQNTQNQQNKGR